MYRRPVISICAPSKAHHSPMVWCTPRRFEVIIDLRTFPRDGHARFVDAVANGKRNMPAWDDVLDPEQIEALWAYVIAGEAGE